MLTEYIWGITFDDRHMIALNNNFFKPFYIKLLHWPAKMP